ncbi:MAG: hypothetical protein ACLRSA_06200 [Streptococcus salivarius]
MSGSFVTRRSRFSETGKEVARERLHDQPINEALEAKQAKSHEGVRHGPCGPTRIVGIIGLLIIPLGSLLFLRSYISLGDSLKLSVTSTVGP